MNIRSIPTAALALLLLSSTAACAKAEPPNHSAPTSVAAGPAGAMGGAGGEARLRDASRARIVTVDMAITVDKVDVAARELRAEVERSGGWVADGSVSGDGDDRVGRFDLRVPAAEVDGVRARVRAMGDVTNDAEKVEDVTEQRADVAARLRAARAQEKRVLELMSGKTATLREVIEAEQELARVRENVERLEAQERALEGKIAMATVHVSFGTRHAQAWQTPGASLARSARTGARGAAALAVYGGMILATVGPTLAPIAAVAFAVAMFVRRRRRATLAALAG